MFTSLAAASLMIEGVIGFGPISDPEPHPFCHGTQGAQIYFTYDLGDDFAFVNFGEKDSPIAVPSSPDDSGDQANAGLWNPLAPGRVWVGSDIEVTFAMIGPATEIHREESDSTSIYEVTMAGTKGESADRVELMVNCGL